MSQMHHLLLVFLGLQVWLYQAVRCFSVLSDVVSSPRCRPTRGRQQQRPVDSPCHPMGALKGTPHSRLRALRSKAETMPNEERIALDANGAPSFSSPETRHVVVVGGGVGGLAVAARIKACCGNNTKVTILEKNSHMGGRCGSFEVEVDGQRIRHERGPSLLLLPDIYRQLFAETTGKSAEDYGLEMKQCIPAYQIVFEDGERISVGFPRQVGESMTPEEQESRRIMDSWEPNGAVKWDEYMAITSAFLDCGLPNFIEEKLDLASFPNFLVQSFRDSAKAWPLKPHSDVLDAVFESNKLKALASFQDLYVGLEPYNNPKLLAGGVLQSTAPAVFGLLAAIELHPSNDKAGVFAPIGGFQAVTDSMEKLAKDLGIRLCCNACVTGVSNDGVFLAEEASDGAATNFMSADLVIVNADLPYAKQSLLISQPDHSNAPHNAPLEKYDWDDSFSFSSGVISFHWSLDKVLDDLNTHNVFLAANSRSVAEASWETLRSETNSHNFDDSPFNFYVHRPSKSDPSSAPPGYDSIMVLVPCTTLLRDEECANLPKQEAIERYKLQFSNECVTDVKRAVLKRLAAIDSLKDIESHIVHEAVDTPATWADQFNLAAGTPFALSHGFAQLSLTRPGPKSTGLANVLFCGASTRPGNGVPLVLIGAKQVAYTAVKLLRKQKGKEVM